MQKKKNRSVYLEGMRHGIPIALGYFAVAFSLGFAARQAGLTAFQGFLNSILHHASAGEYAGIVLISQGASYIETALVILITNARYFLMSCALSQRFSPQTGLLHRLLVGFGITDEIFGISVGREGQTEPFYHYGAMSVAIPFWGLGTVCGILAGYVFPARLVSALSVALYGMFLAIITPPAKKNPVILGVIGTSFLLSFLTDPKVFAVMNRLSAGVRTILLTVGISTIAALFFPVKMEVKSHEE